MGEYPVGAGTHPTAISTANHLTQSFIQRAISLIDWTENYWRERPAYGVSKEIFNQQAHLAGESRELLIDRSLVLVRTTMGWTLPLFSSTTYCAVPGSLFSRHCSSPEPDQEIVRTHTKEFTAERE